MDIAETISSIKLGDKLSINDWKAKYTVCGLTNNFILAHYGRYYTIISRRPWHGFPFNGVRDGDYYCGPDWWSLGYENGYDFTSEDWVNEYLTNLETGYTEISQKRHAPIFFIGIVDHTDKVYRTKKEPLI